MAMDQARSAGFTTMIPPTLVKPRAMEGTGFLGQAADDVYRIEGQDTYLVGTSEVPLAAYHSDEILDAETLPRRYVAFSPCFRKEAGSHGKDTRGIIRVHWFDKVEMFSYTTLEEAAAEHERLLGWEKEWLDKLELAYRVIDVAAGDLGLSAKRKFDCEAWVPTQGRYRELTSTSNCTDFQTRRLDIRGRFPHRRLGTASRRQADRHPQRHPGRHPAHDRGASSRPTSRPTARCGSRRRCSPTCRVARSWSQWCHRWLSERLRNERGSGSRKLVALDIDGTLLKWVEGEGQSYEQISPGAVRRRARGRRRGRPHRARQRPVTARHGQDRRPARPAPGGRTTGSGSSPPTAP